MNTRQSFLAGVRAVLPVTIGIVPFGLVAGAAAVEAGLTPVAGMGLSVFVFAGASQLAAIGLLESGAPALVVVATVIAINARMAMYSASIAPYFERVRTLARFPLAYLLTDQAYAVSVARFERDERTSRPAFYLGTGIPLWIVWQCCTLIGIIAGNALPASIPLDFAVPLVFLALLVPLIENASTLLAALVGGGVAVLGVGFPFNLGLLVGAGCGIGAGALTSAVRK